MKSSKSFAVVAAALVSVALCTVAVGQDHAPLRRSSPR